MTLLENSKGRSYARKLLLALMICALLISCANYEKHNAEPTTSAYLENSMKQSDSGVALGPGQSLVEFTSQGVKRSYILYKPPGNNPFYRLPLVIAFHGLYGHGSKFSVETGFDYIAKNEKFLVAYPNAIEQWNNGHTPIPSEVNDVNFTLELIQHIGRDNNVDLHRIYAVGFSNGGILTQSLACKLSDEIAAFVSVGGTMPTSVQEECKPINAVSMMMINSKDDPYIPWKGGDLTKDKRIGIENKTLSIPDTVHLWYANNGCSPEFSTNSLPDEDPTDGTRVELTLYNSGCNDNSEVLLYTVQGGGHSWPGSPLKPLTQSAGNTSYDINASVISWNFLKNHSLP